MKGVENSNYAVDFSFFTANLNQKKLLKCSFGKVKVWWKCWPLLLLRLTTLFSPRPLREHAQTIKFFLQHQISRLDIKPHFGPPSVWRNWLHCRPQILERKVFFHPFMRGSILGSFGGNFGPPRDAVLPSFWWAEEGSEAVGKLSLCSSSQCEFRVSAERREEEAAAGSPEGCDNPVRRRLETNHSLTVCSKAAFSEYLDKFQGDYEVVKS